MTATVPCILAVMDSMVESRADSKAAGGEGREACRGNEFSHYNRRAMSVDGERSGSRCRREPSRRAGGGRQLSQLVCRHWTVGQ